MALTGRVIPLDMGFTTRGRLGMVTLGIRTIMVVATMATITIMDITTMEDLAIHPITTMVLGLVAELIMVHDLVW